MTHRALTLLAVIGVAFAAAGLLFAGAADASGHSATRTITPASVAAGGQVTVMIEADDLGFAGTVTETLPAGFSYEGSSLNDSDVTENGQDVQFFPDVPGRLQFTYTVTAPMGAGDYTFSGTVQDDPEQDVRDVGGDTDVTVEPPAHGAH